MAFGAQAGRFRRSYSDYAIGDNNHPGVRASSVIPRLRHLTIFLFLLSPGTFNNKIKDSFLGLPILERKLRIEEVRRFL